MSRGLFIDIKKIAENEGEAVYFFSTREEHAGKVSIHKKIEGCFVLEEPEWDKKHGLVARVGQALEVHIKDFVLRHVKLLGLDNPNDISLLQQLKIEEISRLRSMNK